MADIRQSGSYQRIAKPIVKLSWRQKVLNYWRSTWYFERLTALLILIIAPFLAMAAYEFFVVGFELSSEATKIAQTLRQIKERAHELNTFGTFEARPASQHGLSSYQVGYENSKMGVQQVFLPKGLSLVGSVRFDAQGVPERASVLKIRHGLKHKDIVVSAQGLISVP